MKRGLVFFVLAAFIFISTTDLVSAQISLTNLLSNEWFNAGLLFLLIFILCLLALKKVFSASYGTALIISLILGIVGSFSIIAKYGLIFQKFDWWVLLLIALLIISLLMMSSRSKKAATIIFLFTVSIAWFAFGQKVFCPPRGTLPSNACTLLNVLAGILFAIAFFMLLAALFKKSKEMGAWVTRPPEPEKPKKVKLDFWTNKPRIRRGETSTLFWRTKNAVQFSIDGRSLPLKGSIVVRPDSTTTYHGTAIGADGSSVKKSVTIYVGEAPPTEEVTLTIQVQPHNGGTTNPHPGTHAYRRGTTIAITAIPSRGYAIDHWIVNGIAGNHGHNQLRLTLNKDYHVIAVFKGEAPPTEEVTLVIDAQPRNGGTTNPKPGIYKHRKGTTVTITAIPNKSYAIDHWIVNGIAGNHGHNTLTLKLDRDYHVIAVFTTKLKEKKLIIEVKPKGGGKTNPPVGTHVYPSNARVTLTAMPNEGYRFEEWSIPIGLKQKITAQTFSLNLGSPVFDRTPVIKVIAIFKKERKKGEVKPLYVKLQVRGVTSEGERVKAKVKNDTDVKAIATWGGGVPPYSVLLYKTQRGAQDELEKLRSYKGTRASGKIHIKGQTGEKVTIGVLLEDSKNSLRQAEIELEIIE
ncbi:MAG: hypothetical protein QXI41_02075 [Candidatus Pacearchaeota archaeon]